MKGFVVSLFSQRARIKGSVLFSGFLLISLAAKPLGAAEFSAAASTQEGYSSNPLMLSENVQALYGTTNAISLGLLNKLPSSYWSLNSSVENSVFNLSSFNSTDFTGKLQFQKETPRWIFGLQNELTYDTVRTSEQTSYGINQGGIRHLRYKTGPALSYALNTTDKLALETTFSEDTYDSSLYSDYRVISVTPSFLHSFDDRNDAFVSLLAQNYTTLKTSHTDQNTLTPSLGWKHAFSPDFRLTTSVGLQTSRQTGDDITDKSWGYASVFSADLTFKGIQDTFDLVAKRTETPYANGTEPLATVFTLKDSHRLNDTFALNGIGQWQTNSYNNDPSGQTKDFLLAKGGLSYTPSETTELSLSYQYRFETLTKSSNTVEDHAALLSFVYRPKSWTLDF